MELPAQTIESALAVDAVSQEYDWLREHPCLCGGRWELARQNLLKQKRTEAGLLMTDQLQVRCSDCSRERDFVVVVNDG